MMINIKHNEDTGEYHYLELTYHDGEIKEESEKTIKFDSGDPMVDWYFAMKKIFKELIHIDPMPGWVFSSSVDHFPQDNRGYKFTVLKFDKDSNPYLKHDYGAEDTDGIDMIVERGFNGTWEELKERCGDLNKK